MDIGWQYRIVQKDTKWGFHHVFIDENGDISNISDMPAIWSDSIEGLLKEQNLMQKAWDYPTIDYNTGEELKSND
jgi:hypothetical protein